MSDGLIRREQILGRGDVKITQLQYVTNTSLNIAAQYVEANGKFYKFTTPIVHAMTSLAAGYDLHYIYIDDDASTPPTPTIIDSTTEPAYSVTKAGWYNGDDRCIAVVPSRDGFALLIYFDATIINNSIELNFPGYIYAPALATNLGVSSGNWTVPNVNDADVLTPVNAVGIAVNAYGQDVAGNLKIAAASKEFGDSGASVNDAPFMYFSTIFFQASGKIPLAASRKIYFRGETGDDNSFNGNMIGYTFKI